MAIFLGSNPVKPYIVVDDTDRTHEIVGRIISGSYTNNIVTSIQQYAFTSCSKLTSVNFPNVTLIGNYAFSSCTSLTTISFPNVTSIDAYAFSGCSALQQAYFPKVTFIGTECFWRCVTLSEVSLPVIETISTYAFEACYNLVSLNLMGVSLVPTLGGSNVFTSTPIGGYSVSAGQYGSIYVPASLYDSFLTSIHWNDFSSRIVSV